MKKIEKFLNNIRKMGNDVEVSAMFEDGYGALINIDAITIEELEEEFPEKYSVMITRNVDGLIKHYAGFVQGSKIFGMDGSVMMAEIKSYGETIEGQYYDFPKYFFKDGMKRRK
jgi:hypothetical protein